MVIYLMDAFFFYAISLKPVDLDPKEVVLSS
jgi:hypothetical protein